MKGSYSFIPATILSVLLGAGCASTPAPDPAPKPQAEDVATAAPAEQNEDVVIAALPAPQAPETATAAYAPPAESEVVCSLERRTGSNRKFQVCRKRPSALDEAETQRTFDSLRRTQMGEHR